MVIIRPGAVHISQIRRQALVQVRETNLDTDSRRAERNRPRAVHISQTQRQASVQAKETNLGSNSRRHKKNCPRAILSSNSKRLSTIPEESNEDIESTSATNDIQNIIQSDE